MISAVVLLNTDLGTRDKILESLKIVDGVGEAHVLLGIYDFFINIKAKSMEKIKEITR